MMLRWALVCALAVTTACDDPSIDIDVEIPERYQERVAQLTLDIIVPPAGEPFDCDKIAFREVSEDEVRAATLQTVASRAGQPVSFAGIPRTGDKLFRVLGVDTDGQPIIAACAAYGSIDDDVHLSLAGEPTATAVLPNFDTGAALPDTLTVGVVDANIEPIRGVDVRFTVTGPGPDQVQPPPGSALTNDMGRAELAPTAPELPGPIALDVRPRWVQAAPPSLLAWAELPVLLEATLPGEGTSPDLTTNTPSLFTTGRIGPAGEMGVAALGPTDSVLGTGRQVYLAYYDDSVTPPFRTAVSAPIPAAFALGVVDTGDRDQLFTVTGGGWIEIQPSGATVTSPAPKPGRVATAIFPAGACDGPDSSAEVLVFFSDESAGTYGPDGASADSPFDEEPSTSRPLASGCVVSTDDEPYRVVVYNQGGFQQLAVAEMDEVRRAPVPTLAAGLGFVRRVGNAGPYLLGIEVTIEGTALTRYRLLPLGARNLDLEMVTQDPITTVAAASIGGDFDGDGEQDVAALLGFGDSDRGTQFRILQILEVDHAGKRLAGLSPPAEASRPSMWAIDFDGDGVEEIVVGSPLGVTISRGTSASSGP